MAVEEEVVKVVVLLMETWLLEWWGLTIFFSFGPRPPLLQY